MIIGALLCIYVTKQICIFIDAKLDVKTAKKMMVKIYDINETFKLSVCLFFYVSAKYFWR